MKPTWASYVDDLNIKQRYLVVTVANGSLVRINARCNTLGGAKLRQKQVTRGNKDAIVGIYDIEEQHLFDIQANTPEVSWSEEEQNVIAGLATLEAQARNETYTILRELMLDKGNDDLAEALTWMNANNKWPAARITRPTLERRFGWHGSGNPCCSDDELVWAVVNDLSHWGGSRNVGDTYPTVTGAILFMAQVISQAMKEGISLT